MVTTSHHHVVGALAIRDGQVSLCPAVPGRRPGRTVATDLLAREAKHG